LNLHEIIIHLSMHAGRTTVIGLSDYVFPSSLPVKIVTLVYAAEAAQPIHRSAVAVLLKLAVQAGRK